MSRYTVMLVDDEEAIRELTSRYLIAQGFIVIPARNAKDTQLKLLTETPDLILLDIEMPDMDGFALCKEIRKKLSVPIIFLTVRRNTMDKFSCFERGWYYYVTKHFVFFGLN